MARPDDDRLLIEALELADDEGGGRFAPAGPPQRTSAGVTVVHLRQEHWGVPVRNAGRAVRFDAGGSVSDFTGSTVPVPPGARVTPDHGARAAAHAAWLRLFAEDRLDPALAVTGERPEVIAAAPHPAATTVLRKEPFREPILAGLVLDAGGEEPELLWEVRVGLPDAGGSFLVHVAATGEGERPEVRGVRALTSHACSGEVFRYDPRTPRSEVPFPLARDAYPPFGGGDIERPEWVEGEETRGNNALARGPSGSPVRGTPETGGLVFRPEEPQGLEQVVVNAFYLCNFMHDFFLLLGFDEQAGNFQRRNAPGVSGDDDAVEVGVWDTVIGGLAFFQNRPDGSAPSLELGRFGPRHTGLDADIVMHEYVHGVTNRIIGGKHVHTPLSLPQSTALGEGFSDYYAVSVQNYYRRREGLEEEWAYGAWLADRPSGLRTATYREYSNTYGFLNEEDMKPHVAGEVWCAALLDVNAALAGEGERDEGDERGWQLVFDSLSLLHPGPRGPTFLHARDALLSAFDDAVAAGSLPADLREGVVDAFRKRGMGSEARSPDGGFGNVEEAFE